MYVGQGSIAVRVSAHLAKAVDPTHRQAEFFTDRLECSWVAGAWPTHQRLELEDDLIGAHVLAFGDPPTAQFLG